MAAPSDPLSAMELRRPVDLLWLGTSGAAVPSGVALRNGVATATDQAAGPAGRANQTGAMAAACGDASARPAPPVSALDPQLARRLADEVIRRIDHRARIARERRGL